MMRFCLAGLVCALVPSVAEASPTSLDVLGVAPGAQKAEAETIWKHGFPKMVSSQEPYVLSSDNNVQWQFVWERRYTLEPITQANQLNDFLVVHYDPRSNTVLSVIRHKQFARSTQLSSELINGLAQKYGLPSYYFDQGTGVVKLLWADGFPTVHSADKVIYSDHPVRQCLSRVELYASGFFDPSSIINQLFNPRMANDNRFDVICGKTIEVTLSLESPIPGNVNGYVSNMEFMASDLSVANKKMSEAASDFFAKVNSKRSADSSNNTKL